jgi:hypothetical protein
MDVNEFTARSSMKNQQGRRRAHWTHDDAVRYLARPPLTDVQLPLTATTMPFIG